MIDFFVWLFFFNERVENWCFCCVEWIEEGRGKKEGYLYEMKEKSCGMWSLKERGNWGVDGNVGLGSMKNEEFESRGGLKYEFTESSK